MISPDSVFTAITASLIDDGNVPTWLSERTSGQAISQAAAVLLKRKAAECVIVAARPKLRGDDHVTFADRDFLDEVRRVAAKACFRKLCEIRSVQF